MDMERPVLNRSMMEDYEIAVHRPEKLRAVIFGTEEIMLGGVACVLDRAEIGALCVTDRAEQLNAQDGMFTVLLRSDSADRNTELVVQSILTAVDPEKDFEDMLLYAQRDGIDMIFCPESMSAVQFALAARFVHELNANAKPLPKIYLVSDLPARKCTEYARSVFKTITGDWSGADLWDHIEIASVLCDGLYGVMSEKEADKQQYIMNYSDRFLMWAQPDVRLVAENDSCPAFTSVEDINAEIELAAKTDHALEFLCVAGGYLAGKNSFAETLKDDDIRKWIGHAWFDEVLPEYSAIPSIRERTIRAFGRYEDAANEVRLLSAKHLIRRLPETLLPAIRAHADREFEAPRLTVLAISAAIMLYAGVTKQGDSWTISRGDASDRLIEDRDILEAFESMAHDMPAETLAYAVLADRTLWGEDLRDVDGLEMAVMSDISSIQRIGFLQTLANHLAILL